MPENESLHELVRNAQTNYTQGGTNISEYVTWDMHKTIETIDAYLNSKHISGSTDSLGREKPFFNIVTAATNIWYRATDIDRKDIRILPDTSDNTGLAFVATVLLQNWMKTSRFGVFLNEWGRSLARYGSSVVKFVQKDGELVASVIPWNRIIADPIDFDALPTIERIYYTPSQLRKMTEYDQDVVEDLIEHARVTRKTLRDQAKDNQNNFIELYEVHGELPVAYLKKEDEIVAEDWTTYRQQMHVISFIQQENGSVADFTLYSGRERNHPYMITHLIKEDGRTLSIGAVEYLFDAQWMKNHTVKNMKDTLDIASKLIFQTADGSFVGRNVLNSIESGDILTYRDSPLTQVNNAKGDIVALQNFGAEWERLSQTLTSTPEALRGDTLPSGTPYSLGAYLGAQANSLFEIMTENKGLAIEDMMREYILPYLKTKMDTTDEIVAVLDADKIYELDAMYVPREAIRRYNEDFKQSLLKGEIPQDYNPQDYQAQVQNSLHSLGNKRFFKPSDIDDKTWKEALSDFEMVAIVEVTNENTDKQAVVQTLSSVFQTIASNPAVLQDENARMVLSQILTETGKLSPLQLKPYSAPTPPTTVGQGALSGNPLSQINGGTTTAQTGNIG